MANTAGFAASFQADLYRAVHDFANDTLMGALYYSSASLSPLTITGYTPLGEVTGVGYSPGGTRVANAASVASATVEYWNPGSSIVWSPITISDPFNALLLYNASKSNKAIAIWTFSQAVIYNRKLTLNLPAGNPATALIQIAR